MKGFVHTISGVVPDEWIDRNGHMNVTAYMGIFDQGTDLLLQKCGLTDGSDHTVVSARMMIDYRKELLLGEPWQLWSGFSSIQSNTLTIVHRLRAVNSMRATCDIKGNSFSKSARYAVPFSLAIHENFSQFLVSGLADRFSVPDS